MLGKCSTTQLHTEKYILTKRNSIKSNPRHQLTLGYRQVYTISHRKKGNTCATEGSALLLPLPSVVVTEKGEWFWNLFHQNHLLPSSE